MKEAKNIKILNKQYSIIKTSHCLRKENEMNLITISHFAC